MENSSRKININNIFGKLSLIYFFIAGLITSIVFLPSIIASGLLRPVHPLLAKIHFLVMLLTVKFYIFLTPIKYRIIGLDKLRKIKGRRIILVANHRSHIDMFLLLSNIFRLKSVANSYLFKLPILGHMMSLSGHFNFQEGGTENFLKTNKEIEKSILREDRVLFFPETTRCQYGLKGTQKFRLFPFKLAKDVQADVLPIVIKNTDGIWAKGHSFMNYRETVEIEILPLIESSKFLSTVELAKHTKQVIDNLL